MRSSGELRTRIIDVVPRETAAALAELAERLRIAEERELLQAMTEPPAPPIGLAYRRTPSGRLRPR